MDKWAQQMNIKEVRGGWILKMGPYVSYWVIIFQQRRDWWPFVALLRLYLCLSNFSCELGIQFLELLVFQFYANKQAPCVMVSTSYELKLFNKHSPSYVIIARLNTIIIKVIFTIKLITYKYILLLKVRDCNGLGYRLGNHPNSHRPDLTRPWIRKNPWRL